MRAYFFSDVLAVTRIIGRVDVVDRERAHAMDLNDRGAGRPAIVLHAFLRVDEAAGPQRLALLGVELVAHCDMEVAGQDRDVLVGRVRVRGDLVARRQSGADNIGAVTARIAADNGDLCAGRQSRRRRTPFQCVGLNGHMVVRRKRGGGQCGQQQGRDNCLSHDRVPAFGSDVPKQRLIVAPRDAGGDAGIRIPVIKKITNLRAWQVFSLPAIAASHPVGPWSSLTFPSHSQ